tara:strand:+ start:120 stop:746 length:627 start_codon:yes stop_codon:yes gene_type:complete
MKKWYNNFESQKQIRSRNYIDLVKKLKKYNIIIVSGPQRSGTTYCSYILSKNLSYSNIDETIYNTHDEDHFLSLFNQNNTQPSSGIVIQAPAMSHLLHKINANNKLIVLFMRRNNKEIFRSEDRINWHTLEYPTEIKKYHKTFSFDLNEFFKLGLYRNSIMKYYFWEKQKQSMNVDFLEVDYNILSQTDEFIPMEKRKDFNSKQIKPI